MNVNGSPGARNHAKPSLEIAALLYYVCPQSTSDRTGPSLQAASYRGYEVIVRLLLEQGADANAPGGVYVSALQAAP